MDQQLKFQILTNAVGSEKINQLTNNFSNLEKKLVSVASATYIFEKAYSAIRSSINQFTDVVDLGDNLQALSDKIGVSGKDLSALERAAKESHLPLEQLELLIKRLNANLGDPDNEKFKDTLKALGISAKDSSGSLKNASEIVYELSDRFSKMKDGPEKAAFAVRLFGKSGQDIIPLLNMSSEQIKSMGLRMSSDFPKMADKFNDSIDRVNTRLLETKIAVAESVLPSLQSVVDSFLKVNEVSQGNKGFSLSETFKKEFKYLSGFIYQFTSQIVNISDVISTILRETFDDLFILFKETYNVIHGTGEVLRSISTLDFGNIKNAFSGLGGAVKQGASDRRERWSGLASRISTRTEDASLFGELVNNDFKEIENRSRKSINKYNIEDSSAIYKQERESIEKYIIAQNAAIETDKEKMNLDFLSQYEIKKKTVAIQLNSEAEKMIIGWSQQSKDAIRDKTQSIIEQKLALIDLEEQNKRSFMYGARSAFTQYKENISNVAQFTEQAFTRAFSNMEDALVSFVRSGKLNFETFTNAVLDDIARMAIRATAVNFLSFFAGSSAGINNTPSSGTGYLGADTTFVPKYGSGGVVSSPKVALIGEAGPEAVVPLSGGRSIPVQMKGYSESNVNVNVVVNMENGNESVKSSNNNSYSKLGMMIESSVRGIIIKEKRAGGLLAS